VRQWQVEPSLSYGPVKTCSRQRKFVRVSHVMRLGTQADFSAALQGMGFGGAAEHGFYRARECDRPPWNSRAGSPDLGHRTAVSTAACPSGVLAGRLPFCTSP